MTTPDTGLGVDRHPTILIDPPLTPAQLYDFYRRNQICEANYAQARAAVVLRHPSLIVAAFDGDELVGIARVLTDGLAAAVMELSLDLRYQGPTPHANGSLIEGDTIGLGRRIGTALLDELAKREIDFVSAYIVESAEEPFYESLGFIRNTGHVVYYIDKRPYV